MTICLTGYNKPEAAGVLLQAAQLLLAEGTRVVLAAEDGFAPPDGGERKRLHCLFQLEAAAAHIADVMAAHLHLGGLGDHHAGLVRFLLIHKHNAGHDKGLGALPAGHKAVLAKILIKTDLQCAAPRIRAPPGWHRPDPEPSGSEAPWRAEVIDGTKCPCGCSGPGSF